MPTPSAPSGRGHESAALPGHQAEQASVVVLAADAVLLDQTRTAIEGLHRLWRAESLTHAAELLVASSHSVLVLDASVTGQDTAEVVTRLRQQLPELQIVVAGRRDDEAGLVALISSGDVYRFLHKPVSIERARNFIDGAARRRFALGDSMAARDESGTGSTSSGRSPAAREPLQSRLLSRLRPKRPKTAAVLVLATLAIGSGIAWRPIALDRLVSVASPHVPVSRTRAAPVPLEQLLARADAALAAGRLAEPPGNNAVELYRQVLRIRASDPAARRGLSQAGRRLLDRAEQALAAGNLADAATMLDAAHFAEPEAQRWETLRQQLEAARVLMNARPPPGTVQPLEHDTVPHIDQHEARALVGLATQRIASGHLVGGPQSAAAVLATARQANPDDPAVDAALDRLSGVMVLRARESLAARRFSEAARWTGEVEALGRSDVTAAALRTELSATQVLATREDHLHLLALANQRIAQDRLLEPEADSAQHYVDLLRAADVAFPGLRETTRALSGRLLALAQQQARERQWTGAERSLRAAGSLGEEPEAVAGLGETLRRVRSADQQPPLVPDSILARIHDVAPTYPAQAARIGVTGTVEVEFTVGADGATGNLRIASSSPPEIFDAAAAVAVAQWRYRPADVDGIPIPVRTRVRLRFELKRR